MTIFYSASKNSFYSDDFQPVSTIPQDKVVVTEEEWRACLKAQNEGKVIRPGSNGKPQAYEQEGTDGVSKVKFPDVKAEAIEAGSIKAESVTSTSQIQGENLSISQNATISGTIGVTGRATFGELVAAKVTSNGDVVSNGNFSGVSLTASGWVTCANLSTGNGQIKTSVIVPTDSNGHVNFQATNGGGWFLDPASHGASAWEKIATENWVNSNFESTIPAGTLVFFAGVNVPNGWLLCNGMSISRTSFSRLFAAIGTRYGEGNGSTTFNVPNIHHRFIEATTATNEVGQFVEAGLPNIVGGFGDVVWQGKARDAFFLGAYGSTTARQNIYNDGRQILGWVDFDAHHSNPIYGASDTAQPKSIRLLTIIRT